LELRKLDRFKHCIYSLVPPRELMENLGRFVLRLFDTGLLDLNRLRDGVPLLLLRLMILILVWIY